MEKIFFYVLLFPLMLFSQQTPVDLELNTEDFNDIALEVSEGVYDITTTGNDPYIFTEPLEADLNKTNTHLSFEYFCPTGVDFIEIYFNPLKEGSHPKRIGDG